MIAVVKKLHESSDLVNLRRILENKFFYKFEFFKNRTNILQFPSNSSSKKANALCFEVFEDAPFLLAVASPQKTTNAIRDQVFSYALTTDTIGTILFYASSTSEIEVLRRRFTDSKFESTISVEYYHIGESPRGNFRSLGKKAYQTNLLPITKNLENLFFEIHSIMRDTDGLHADAALEELCKLIYLKSFIEEHSDELPIKPIDTDSFGTTEEFAACLRTLYRLGNNRDIREFSQIIPEYERSRGVFQKPFFLSSAALAKSFRSIEKFTLKNSDVDVKGRAFQKVLASSVRSGMGQYFTPAQVCNMIVEIISPTSSDLILDPFCGSGHFLSQSLAYVRSNCPEDSKDLHEFAYGNLHGIEKSDRMTRVAMTDMRLNGNGHSNIRCTDALLDFSNYPDLKASSFDIVLTNPPFGSLLGAEAFASLAKFELAERRSRVSLEIVGLERSIQFLRPGGKLAIVLPDSIFSAISFEYVREWLKTKISVRIIVGLPVEAFSPYGANIRSGILFARKLREGETPSNKDKVCMIRLDNLGYDAAGRIRSGSEQSDAIEIAKSFLNTDGW